MHWWKRRNLSFDLCNQAVDYFGWAIYRKWDSEDKRSYQLIKKQIKSEFALKQNDPPNFSPKPSTSFC